MKTIARLAVALVIAGGTFLTAPVHAQNPPAPEPPHDSKPPAAQKPDRSVPPSTPAPSPTKDSAPPSATKDQPQTYDPYHAAKSVEIGLYYERKGDLDAAIDRFKDAIRYKPDYAKPRLLLAEIYEKRHDDSDAIQYYTEYLKVLPTAPDAKRVKGRIEKLSKRLNAKN